MRLNEAARKNASQSVLSLLKERLRGTAKAVLIGIAGITVAITSAVTVYVLSNEAALAAAILLVGALGTLALVVLQVSLDRYLRAIHAESRNSGRAQIRIEKDLRALAETNQDRRLPEPVTPQGPGSPKGSKVPTSNGKRSVTDRVGLVAIRQTYGRAATLAPLSNLGWDELGNFSKQDRERRNASTLIIGSQALERELQEVAATHRLGPGYARRLVQESNARTLIIDREAFCQGQWYGAESSAGTTLLMEILDVLAIAREKQIQILLIEANLPTGSNTHLLRKAADEVFPISIARYEPEGAPQSRLFRELQDLSTRRLSGRKSTP